jgi:pimeloyl-ACP methyl ester carboxylesterase
VRRRPRVVVVPGLAVHRYVRDPCAALAEHGCDVELETAPGARGAPAHLDAYGKWLATRLRTSSTVDLLIGLSVGAQAAAVAAATTPVRHLALVSPTVAPTHRSLPALLAAWLREGRQEPARLLIEQLPDWLDAGPRRIVAVIRSALTVHLEDVLDRVAAPLSVVYGDQDMVSSYEYAAALAAGPGRRLLVVPGAAHSWPYRDPTRFVEVARGLLSQPVRELTG